MSNSELQPVGDALSYLMNETVSLTVAFTPAEVAAMILGLTAAIQNADKIQIADEEHEGTYFGLTEPGVDMMIHAVERLSFAADKYLNEIGFDPDQAELPLDEGDADVEE